MRDGMQLALRLRLPPVMNGWSSFARSIRAGDVTLFTGSGFSCDARDRDGRSIPSGDELRCELWALCFSDEPQDESSLADLFSHALARFPEETRGFLERRLVVDPATLPAHFEVWFSMPWRRAYTLNIDDLESAVVRRFSLPRSIEPISDLADDPRPPSTPSVERPLEFVHLNGTIADAPDRITFSTLQYAQRIVGDDAWYAEFGKDVDRGRFLFVGTRLDEAPLWQHIEHCSRRALRDRPCERSLLVTKHVTRARRSLLEGLAIDWLPLTTEEFATQYLAPLRARVRKP